MLGVGPLRVLNGVMNKRCDIAIVGGGLNGLTTALALAQAGFDVVVVERADPAKQREDSFDGRVSSIAYSSKLVLDALGAWEAMTAITTMPILATNRWAGFWRTATSAVRSTQRWRQHRACVCWLRPKWLG